MSLFQVRIKPAYCYPEECSEKEPAFCGDCTSGCIKESSEDKAFHGMLAKVSTAFGANISMFDIPKMFNPRMPGIYLDPQIVPIYTLCQTEPRRPLLVQNLQALNLIGDLDDCSKYWQAFISDSENLAIMNPYLLPKGEYLSMCGHGLGNVTR